MKKKQHLNKKQKNKLNTKQDKTKVTRKQTKKHNKSKFDDSFVSGQSKLGQHGEYDQLFHGEYSVMQVKTR